ncbi:hypothetical protein EMIT0111MI5_20494 [Burkholderia sp. IT-111MI5]
MAAVRAFVHPLRRPRQPRDRGRRDQGRARPVEHRARRRILRVRVFVCNLPDRRRLDRRPVRRPHHADRLRADLGRVDLHDGARAQSHAPVRRAPAARHRGRRDAARPGPRDHALVPARAARRRARLHAFVLAARQRGHAADRRRADDVAVVARRVLRDRRGDAGVARLVGRRLPRASARRRRPRTRRRPPRATVRPDAVGAAVAPDGADDLRLLLLRLDRLAVLHVAADVLPERPGPEPEIDRAVRVRRVLRGRGRRHARRLALRPDLPEDRQPRAVAPERDRDELRRRAHLPAAARVRAFHGRHRTVPVGVVPVPRTDDRADLGRAERHRADPRRHRERDDERRFRDRGDPVADPVRLSRRPHRQLDGAVHRIGRDAADRHRRRAADSPGPHAVGIDADARRGARRTVGALNRLAMTSPVPPAPPSRIATFRDA